MRATVVALALCASPARADDYFAGREITLYVGSSPGGPYDAYGRLIARRVYATPPDVVAKAALAGKGR
ncbi:MAG TPA: hypothetical protein VIY51_00210 [Xanthobacteraceae bacterium]